MGLVLNFNPETTAEQRIEHAGRITDKLYKEE